MSGVRGSEKVGEPWKNQGVPWTSPPLTWACFSLSGHLAQLRGLFDCGLLVRPQNKRFFSSNLKAGFFGDYKWISHGVF